MLNILSVWLKKPKKIYKPWNKGKLVGQKKHLEVGEVRRIRRRLKRLDSPRNLALFNLALDSGLMGCDLLKLRVNSVSQGNGTYMCKYGSAIQQKTKKPVWFDITAESRRSLSEWIKYAELSNDDYLFKGRTKTKPHICTKQYRRMVKEWVSEIGLDPALYATNSIRITKGK